MRWRQSLWILPLLILPLSASFFASGLELEADNLKYMGIAWGMQHSDHYIIPMANGEFYTDKPPLLFWMMVLCWHIFGMNMLGLQSMICLLLGLWVWLTKATYTTLFPRDFIGQALLPYIIIGCFSFFSYAHFLHVDLFLVTGVLLTNLGICKRLCGEIPSKSAALLSSLCIIVGVFLGLFAKGPVIYVFTLLPFLLGSLINKSYRTCCWKIVGKVLLGTVLFVCAWVVPVIFNASNDFLQQILYGQIAHRAVSHDDKSCLFYFIKLPYMLLPWVIGLVFIRKFSATMVTFYKEHLFICLVIIVGVLVLTFFGQKRFWYLLPCIPYALIVFTRFFVTHEREVTIFRCRFSLAHLLKISGFTLALVYFSLSPYFFASMEKDAQVNTIKKILQQPSQKIDGIVIFSEENDVYGFNYFAKMIVIPVIHDMTELQQWSTLHPRGMIITGSEQCPTSSHLMIASHEMGYLLCKSN
jgi:4-amino-4-deoxy-L-arabinose transferase-like glycosyltransferase